MTSPTARSLAELKRRGYPAQVVEHWNAFSRRRIDLFGVIDLVALTPDRIIGIQACSGTDHAKRLAKILAEPRAKAWIDAGGRIEVWSWSKRGKRGKAKRWTLRSVEVRAEDFAETAPISPAAALESSAPVRGRANAKRAQNEAEDV